MMQMNCKFSLFVFMLFYLYASVFAQDQPSLWEKKGSLKVSENGRYLQHADGTPFLWLGGTAWSMYINADREDIITYFDNRKAKGLTAIQAVAYPFAYPDKEDNHKNRYGHRPFEGTAEDPDLGTPLVVEGGSPDTPNDYWDHSDFMVREAKKRGMLFAILPCWGSGFINNHGWGGWHDVQFTIEQARAYGKFLAERYRNEPHIIWVLGGDTEPDDKIQLYRAMAEGIIEGAGGADNALITYHPVAYHSSSEWFHDDYWLDFNMVESHRKQEQVVDLISKDYNKIPVKPTMLAEGNYESEGGATLGIHRDAFHSYLSGGMGYVYGLGLPVPVWDFSPEQNWRDKLDAPGASDLPHIKKIISACEWWKWIPDQDIFEKGKGNENTVTEKVAVKSSEKDEIVVYFADNSPASINLEHISIVNMADGTWFNPGNGDSVTAGSGFNTSSIVEFKPPANWDDAILILEGDSAKQ